MGRILKKPSPMRIVYWLVMLTAIGLLLFYIQRMLAPYNNAGAP